jgi:hypothetical protein
MVASFSEVADQLSQWRGYADNSTGVSIGLDLRDIRPASNIGTTVTFAPCLYRNSDKSKLLKTIFAQYKNSIQDWWNTSLDRFEELHIKGVDHQTIKSIIYDEKFAKVTEQCFVSLQFDLIRIAALLKDEGFSEEREWRLVLPQEAKMITKNYNIEFRPTRDTIVPYIAYPLNRPNKEGPIPCNDLILGPGSHPSAAISVNLFLRMNDIPTLARLSKIPYRPT